MALSHQHPTSEMKVFWWSKRKAIIIIIMTTTTTTVKIQTAGLVSCVILRKKLLSLVPTLPVTSPLGQRPLLRPVRQSEICGCLFLMSVAGHQEALLSVHLLL